MLYLLNIFKIVCYKICICKIYINLTNLKTVKNDYDIDADIIKYIYSSDPVSGVKTGCGRTCVMLKILYSIFDQAGYTTIALSYLNCK